MSLSCTGHLRAWIVEQLEVLLQNQSETTLLWAENLTGALLSGLIVPELFLEASCILPAQGFQHFILWSLRNYPTESIAALTHNVQLQANAATTTEISEHCTPYEQAKLFCTKRDENESDDRGLLISVPSPRAEWRKSPSEL